MNVFMEGYEAVLAFIANFAIYTLELVGILIIVAGSFKSFGLCYPNLRGNTIPIL